MATTVDGGTLPAALPSSPSTVNLDSSSDDSQNPQPNSDHDSPSNQNTSPSSADAPSVEAPFMFGPYVPISRRDNGILIDPTGIVEAYTSTNENTLERRSICEVLPDDAILETPSLITPLLLKKHTIWPPKQDETESTSELNVTNLPPDNPDNDQTSADTSDDIQIIRVVNTDVATGSISSNRINYKDVDEYIKQTTVASLTNTKTKTKGDTPILVIEDYFKSSVGKLLLGIGLSRVNEFELKDKHRRLHSKIKKAGDRYAHLIPEYESVKAELHQAELFNRVYKADKIISCPHCAFRSEFQTVMDGHLEVPHTNSKRDYLCNWCDFRVKDSNQIVFHFYSAHKKRCRIEKPVPLHVCTYCSFECRSKRKLATHLTRCELAFPHEDFLGPQDYGDFPTITSKFILQKDVRTYEHTLKTLRLAAHNPYQIKVSGTIQPNVGQPILLVPRTSSMQIPSAENIRVGNYIVTSGNQPVAMTVGLSANKRVALANPSQNINYTAHLLSNQNTGLNKSKTSTLQYPPQTQSPFVNGKAVINAASGIIMAPPNYTNHNNSQHQNAIRDLNKDKDDGQNGQISATYATDGSVPNPKGSTFVICEICDGYIKDLGQLKSHMQWIHKVKLHQKMLESRPPLNCQKCQWRFFTDQGLERHLLGVHALVTSNMQEQVDQGTDSGRCTVCGRAYTNKLVAHMREVHKSNLKPAHLSYKCTVCSATFSLYRLFENHVYSVHSESVRKISGN